MIENKVSRLLYYNFSNNKEELIYEYGKNIPITPITREEMVRNQYSYSTVWFPIDLENKIIEKLATNKCINRP